MDFSHYTDHPVSLAMSLVNTGDSLSGEDAIDTVEGLEGFVASIHPDLGAPDWDLTPADVTRIQHLRARLREVFAAAGDEVVAAAILNGILSEAGAVPRVSVHDGVEPHLHFEPVDAGPFAWLGATSAMGLSVVVCDHGSARLGICDATACADVYIDTSRNRSRRYCSDTCSTREHVAAFRKRRQGAGA